MTLFLPMPGSMPHHNLIREPESRRIEECPPWRLLKSKIGLETPAGGSRYGSASSPAISASFLMME